MNSFKIRYIISGLLLIFCGIFAWSCKDDLKSVEIPEPGNPSDDKANFSLQINPGIMPNGLTGSAQLGLLHENQVKSVRVVLYDGTIGVADPVVKYAFDFGIRSVDDGVKVIGFADDPYASSEFADEPPYLSQVTPDGDFITCAREVEKQAYKMLVIINPSWGASSSYSRTTRGEILNSLNTKASIYDDDVMSNNLYYITRVGQPLSALTKAVFMPDDVLKAGMGTPAEEGRMLMTNHQDLITIKASDLKATEADAERFPVKVKVERAMAKIIVTKDDNIQVKPDNAEADVDNMLWATGYTNNYMYWMRNLTYKKGRSQMEQQGDTDIENFYARDPNFTGPIPGTANYYVDPDPFNNYNFNNVSDDEYKYVTENTLDAGLSYQESATRVVIRATYTPDKNIIPLGDSYFLFNGIYITTDDMSDWYDDLLEGKDPEGISQLAGLSEAVRSIYNDNNDYFDYSGYNAYNAYGLKCYSSGRSHYSVMVRHFDTSDEYGKYGVVRNNIYNVNIASIQGPGEPLPEDAKGKYISAQVVIHGWGDKATGIELGDLDEEEPDGSYVIYKFYYDYSNGSKLFATVYEEMPLGAPVPKPSDEFLRRVVDEKLENSQYYNPEPYYIDWRDGMTVDASSEYNVIRIYYEPYRYDVGYNAYFYDYNGQFIMTGDQFTESFSAGTQITEEYLRRNSYSWMFDGAILPTTGEEFYYAEYEVYGPDGVKIDYDSGIVDADGYYINFIYKQYQPQPARITYKFYYYDNNYIQVLFKFVYNDDLMSGDPLPGVPPEMIIDNYMSIPPEFRPGLSMSPYIYEPNGSIVSREPRENVYEIIYPRVN